MIVEEADSIWIPVVRFENAMVDSTKTVKEYTLHAITQTTKEQPDMHDPYGAPRHLGTNTLLSIKRRYQVSNFSFIGNISYRVSKYRGLVKPLYKLNYLSSIERNIYI